MNKIIKRTIIAALVVAHLAALCACMPSRNDAVLGDDLKALLKDDAASAPGNAGSSKPAGGLGQEAEATPTPTPVPTPTPTPNIRDLIRPEEIDLHGQTIVQIQAHFAYYDGWIYGQIFTKKGNPLFVKTNEEMKEWVQLDDGAATSIHVVGDYVYYQLWRNDPKDNGIYRVKTNGEGKEMLAKAGGHMQVRDGSIYYTDFHASDYDSEDKCHLYRCDLDGKNVKKIIDKPVFYFYVFNNVILFQDDLDGESLHLRDIDGTNDRKLNDARSFHPIYDGEHVYYRQLDRYGVHSIWRMRLDGSENEMLCSLQADELALFGDYVYFNNFDDDDTLYRMNKDGSNPMQVLSDKRVARVQFINDKLKYTIYAKEYKYIDKNILAEPDGSGKRQFKK